MDNPTVSIIVPIYNVEPYLRRCIDSVINQTYANLEIILVDDGSPDKCSQICDEYAAKDNRITVIHKRNGGLSDARNAGLQKVSSEYIFFVDSDDFITQDCIEIFISESRKKNYDVLIAQHTNAPNTRCNDKKTTKEISTNLLIAEAFCKTIFLPCAWNKLYKTSFIKKNSIAFHKGILFEDQLWSIHWVTKASNICIIPHITYIYNTRNASIMSSCRMDLPRCLASWERIISEYNRILSNSNLPQQLKYNIFIQKIEESLSYAKTNFLQFKDLYERIQKDLSIQSLYEHYKTNSITKNALYKLFGSLPSILFQFLLYFHIKTK